MRTTHVATCSKRPSTRSQSQRLLGALAIVMMVAASCSVEAGGEVVAGPEPTVDTSTSTSPEPSTAPTVEAPTPTAIPPTPEPSAAPTPAPVPAVDMLIFGESATGTLDDPDRLAVFEVRAEAGDVLSIVVEPLDEDLDVVVDVLDSEDRSVIGGELDDSFNTERVGALRIEETGVYTVRVSSFDDTTGTVSVLVDTKGSADGELIVFGETNQIDVTATDDVAQAVFAAEEGEWIDITVVPIDEVDVVVDIRDAAGVSVLADGPVDRSFDTERIRVLEIPADGVYSVVVSGYLGVSGTAELTVERANDGSGTLLRGTDSIDDPTDVHAFPFNGRAGDVVRLLVDPDEVDHDVVVSVVDSASNTVLDQVDASTGLEELAFDVPADGDYYFEVSSFDDSTGGYGFELLAPATSVLALAPGDALTGRLGDSPSLQYTFQPSASGSLVVTVDGLDDTEVGLSLFDVEQDQIVEAEDSGVNSQMLSYEVTADGLYFLDVTSPAGGGAFELDLTLS